MQLAVQVTFKNVKRSEWVEALVIEHAQKLDLFFDRITSCRVVIDMPHKHQGRDKCYQVLIDLTVPGEEIVVNREAAGHAPNEDIIVAVGDSFDCAKRLLEDYARRRRHNVKTHKAPNHARVARLFPEQGYGFLETDDGRDVYFHSHSLIGEKFEHIEIGTEVNFSEEEGDKGPQASSVKVSKKRDKIGGALV